MGILSAPLRFPVRLQAFSDAGRLCYLLLSVQRQPSVPDAAERLRHSNEHDPNNDMRCSWALPVAAISSNSLQDRVHFPCLQGCVADCFALTDMHCDQSKHLQHTYTSS